MTTKTPLISVITPVRNGERFLASALQTILDQTISDFEVLIVDDQSTDATPRVIDELKLRDCRVRAFPGPGRGPGPASNVAIRQARGAYLAKVDADDLTLPDRFEKQVRFLEANPACVAVGGQCELIDELGRPLGPMSRPTTHEEIDALLLAGLGSAILQPCVMFRTDAVRQLGMYEESYFLAEDHDLFLKLAEIGHLANLPDILFKFRKHTTSTTGIEPLSKSVQRTVLVLAKAMRRRGLPGEDVVLSHHYRPETPEALFLRWAVRSFRHGHWSTGFHYSRRAIVGSAMNPIRMLKEWKRGILPRKEFRFQVDALCDDSAASKARD